ncbi:MAG: thioredoxin domain-containing protein, partial [Proteobacteria bacterium]|nr:thioredoxin domain-containing protein [Pseudomonadota bacterium]
MKDTMHRYVMLCIIMLLGLSLVHSIAGVALAATEWEVLKTLSLEEKPLDVAVSLDGTKAYILGNKNIFIYATDRGEVVDKIPLKDEFSQISISPDGESLYLTNSGANQISVIRISTVFTIETGNSPVIGNPKAPTHIVAFLDYQCPYCASMFPILTQLLDKYPQQVNLIIKHFPLRMHRSAEKAALACLASAKQKKYRELSDLYFKNYTQLNDETIKSLAQQAGL